MKTTPSTLLSHILSEACLVGGFEVSAFDLQTQSRKKIDLSLSFRLSGLPNNATLEMIPKLTANNAQVEIALQVSFIRIYKSEKKKTVEEFSRIYDERYA